MDRNICRGKKLAQLAAFKDSCKIQKEEKNLLEPDVSMMDLANDFVPNLRVYLDMQTNTMNAWHQLSFQDIDKLNELFPNEDTCLNVLNESDMNNLLTQSFIENHEDVLNNIQIEDLDILDENLVPLNAFLTISEENEKKGGEDNIFAISTSATKKGTERKRKKYIKTKSERREVFLDKRRLKHSVKAGCHNCKKKCFDKFFEEERLEINKNFWRLNDYERKLFMSHHIERILPQRRTASNNTIKRENTLKYFLKDKTGKNVFICKKFFLCTLGFAANNDSVLRSVYKDKSVNDNSNTVPKKDRRGSAKKNNKIDREVIKSHVESFCPNISHYRREHAPNRRYLPSDLSVIKMYENFREKHPQVVCSYNIYRETVTKDLNISFTKLGHEECEKCDIHQLHKKTHSLNAVDDCEECLKWDMHINNAKKAREEYRIDAEKPSSTTSAIFSADMQKIIMLPRMEMYKQVIFCPRLTAYNETFVPVGKLNKGLEVPLAVMWHEAIAGRRKEDVVSAFYAFFLSVRNYEHITLWLDNCSAQNKNWCLLSFLVYLMNSTEVGIEKITFKYFEPGHTFMSADSFHHQIESKLRANPKVFDFSEFASIVRQCNNKKVQVKEMSFRDFRKWPDMSSVYAIQKSNGNNQVLLKDIYVIEARKGEKHLFYKKSFEEQEGFKVLNFIGKKFLKNHFKIGEPLEEENGISKERKDKILTTLSPLIPPHYLQFWKDLKVRQNGNDDNSE